jgi:hypothetical protein
VLESLIEGAHGKELRILVSLTSSSMKTRLCGCFKICIGRCKQLGHLKAR